MDWLLASAQFLTYFVFLALGYWATGLLLRKLPRRALCIGIIGLSVALHILTYSYALYHLLLRTEASFSATAAIWHSAFAVTGSGIGAVFSGFGWLRKQG